MLILTREVSKRLNDGTLRVIKLLVDPDKPLKVVYRIYVATCLRPRTCFEINYGLGHSNPKRIAEGIIAISPNDSDDSDRLIDLAQQDALLMEVNSCTR